MQTIVDQIQTRVQKAEYYLDMARAELLALDDFDTADAVAVAGSVKVRKLRRERDKALASISNATTDVVDMHDMFARIGATVDGIIMPQGGGK